MTALETAEPSAGQTTKGLTAETSNSDSDATDTHSTVDPSAEADRAISSTSGPTDNARFIGVSDAATVSTAEVHDVGLVVGSRLLKTTADPLPPFRRLLAELGIAPDEPVSICHAPEGGKFTATLGTAAGAPGRAFPFVGREHVWFGVNPLRPDLKFGKGTADDVARITSLYSDWDVKPGGLKSTDECRTAIAMVSAALGGRQPVALVLTGSGGIHPYHRLADYPPEDHARAVRDLRAYGMLAKAVAIELGGSVDTVQNPDRIMRAPGTANMKPGCGEVTVEFWDDNNPDAERDEITLDALEACLLEAGIRLEEPGMDGYQKAADEDIVRMVDWPESGTCPYVAAMVEGWKKDVPKKNRHNWVLYQLHRVFAARRLGHISRADRVSAVAILKERFLYLHEQGLGGPVQVVDRYEFAGCVAWALSHVEEATEEYLRADLKHDKCSFYADDGAVAGGDGDDATERYKWNDRNLRSHQRIAARYATYAKGEVMYVHGAGWHYWDDSRWSPDATGAHAKRLLSELLKVCWLEALGDKDLQSDVRACMTASGSRGVLELAASHKNLFAEEVDSNPWLLNCQNGTLDLHTFTLRAHDPADRITKVCAAAYVPDAEAPTWKYLTESSLTDEDVRGFLQRYAGLALVGRVIEHILVILTGEGRNGKGTMAYAIAKALGNTDGYAITGDSSMLIAGRYGDKPSAGELASQYRLRGARWVVLSEISRGSRMDEATMKRLTGGDRLQAKRMGMDPVDFAPSHSLAMLANDLPVADPDAKAVWARLRCVPFTVDYTGHEDNTLEERLELELEGVLAWCVEGLRDYIERGRKLDEPDAVLTRTSAYRDDNDALGRFIAEECVEHGGATITKAEFADAYASWALREREPELGPKIIAARLAKRAGITEGKSHGVRSWVGIGLPVPESPEPKTP